MAGSSDGTVDEVPEVFGRGENVENFAEHDGNVGGGAAIAFDSFQREFSIGTRTLLFFNGDSLLQLLLLLLLLLTGGGGGAVVAGGGCGS